MSDRMEEPAATPDNAESCVCADIRRPATQFHLNQETQTKTKSEAVKKINGSGPVQQACGLGGLSAQ